MTGKQLNYYHNKTILITGGTGYIGSMLVKKLKKVSCKIIALNSKADIRARNFWKKYLGKVNIIFHLAAQTSSKLANENPLLDTKINLLPIINLVETCQKLNLFPDIIFAGTVTQVGLTKTHPVDESFQDKPITVYDINKLAAEKYLQYYSNQLGGQAVTLRLSNVYGPGPISNKKDRGILNLFVRKALRGENLTIYGRGNFIRDYTYIDDVVNAFLAAGINIDKVKGNYYLIGSGKGHTIKEMVKLIKNQVAQKTGRKVKIASIPLPKDISPIESRSFIADSSQFTKATGWSARTSLSDGINKTINYFIKDTL